MSLTQLFVILRVHRKMTLLIVVIALCIGLASSLLVAKKYTATGAVLVDMKAPDPVAGVVLPSSLLPGLIVTEVDLMLSERVAIKAITLLGLDEDPDLRAQWQKETKGAGDYFSWLSGTLQRKLEVKPSRDSNVVGYSYVSASPEFAAAVVNAFMQAYIDMTTELRVERARTSNTFFDERAKQLRDSLEQAQNRLSTYQRESGVITTNEMIDVENARLAGLTNQLVALQASSAMTASRKGQATEHADQLLEVLGNPVVANLSTEISHTQSQFEELGERLGPRHPQVRELQARLDQLRAQRDAETQRVAGSLGVDDSANRKRLTQLEKSIAEQRVTVLHLKSLRDEALVLARDVESTQHAYDAVLARVGETSLASQNTMTNVSVVKRATPPPAPTGPKRSGNLMMALFVGLFLGGAASLARELLDRRTHTPEDIAQLLRQPVLGVIPAPLPPRRRGLRQLIGRLAPQRLAAPPTSSRAGA